MTNDDDYFFNVYSINDRRTNHQEIVATQSVTKDVGYCFSEVLIRFRSTNGTFYSPAVRSSYGTFVGTDFQGLPADYQVGIGLVSGTPLYLSTATNEGQIVMLLPQGDYTLYPSVTPGSGSYGTTGLRPIDISVGCGQRIAIEPCLQIKLEIPRCSSASSLVLTGAVRSCTNKVTSISSVLNGAAPVNICTDCGADPDFTFTVSLVGGDNTITVTATDETGGRTSVTGVIRADTTAPVIRCPTNIVVECAGTNGAVNYTVTATDDCDPTPVIVCDPPSGSVFPPGDTTVNCTAKDAAGNISTCSFVVTVRPGGITIERTVTVRWECGFLQGADNAEGPYTDIPGATSPYTVSTSDARKFYRTRD